MIIIGTSGWVYKHWIGCFYPPALKQKDWLSYFASHFSTVEINRSFYRLPTHENFVSWSDQVGHNDRFIFATKASRYLTHLKRLYGPEEPLARLLDAASGLGWHTGPYLFQLPPGMRIDHERLRYFISKLPFGLQAAFEFRDNSWYAPEIYQLLNDTGCAIVRAVGGHFTPMDVPDTGSFSYIRVHGGQYGWGLDEGELQFWADRIRWEASQGRNVYVYFNNDPGCHAIYNAYRLREILGEG